MIEKGRIRSAILIGALLVGMLSICTLGTAIARGAEGTQAVEYTKLIPFMPKAPLGWEAADEPQGFSFTHEEGTWSMASARYIKTGSEDLTADVMMNDYAQYTTGWTGAWKGYYAWESTKGYMKSVSVKGYPAWEIHEKDPNHYSLYVGLNDRFLVFVGTNGDKDTLYKFVDAIDYKGIAALGPGPATAKPTTQPTSEPEEPSTEEESSETPGFELTVAVLGILATVALFVRRRG